MMPTSEPPQFIAGSMSVNYVYCIESDYSLRHGMCLMFILTRPKKYKILDDMCIDIKNNDEIFVSYPSEKFLCHYNNVIIKDILSNYENIKKIEINIEKVSIANKEKYNGK